MDQKYLKDFVIALVVILLIAFAIKDYYLYQRVQKVPVESEYKKLALGDQLLEQIQDIEHSISDRKGFVFKVDKDPLEQNLIVRTQKDIEAEWREKVESMVRLQSTIIPQNGIEMAAVSYEGETKIYKIGDDFIYGKVVDILEGELIYNFNGKRRSLTLEKIPPKPDEIQKTKSKKERIYNW
ncbi:MAG: hypothetical protein HQ534_04290 [Armatimonadetes bacterium]|nr:hypothetical protein [Armatimonadota bacterium]